MKKLIIFIIIMIICLIFFISYMVSYKPKSTQGATEKIEKYLEQKYPEKFDNIEFISTVQNSKRISVDGNKILDKKIKNSYKHYFKVYSQENDLEFYVVYEKIKEDNGEKKENLYDTYLSFKELKDDANKLLAEIEELGLKDLVSNTHVQRNAPYIYKYIPNIFPEGNYIKELSKVDKENYKFNAYYKDSIGKTTGEPTYTFFCFRLNLKLDSIRESYKEKIVSLCNLIEQMNTDTNNHIKIIIMTQDNFALTMAENKNNDISILVYSIKPNDYKDIKESLEAFYNSKVK